MTSFLNAVATLKDSCKDQRCFILGNGPSIKQHDLTWIRQEHTFVVNLFTLHPEFLNFKNCYYCLGDSRFYQNQKLLPEITQSLSHHLTVNSFFEERARPAVTHETCLDSERLFFVEIDHAQKCWEGMFHADLSRKLCWGYSVVIDQCLPLAIYMGFNPIYLLGCDCDYNLNPAKPDFTNSFFYNPKTVSGEYLTSLYHSSQVPDEFNLSGKIIDSYQVVKRYCDTHSIHIFNAGAGGKLNVFERVAYPTLF
ncbi:MAG: hypothetical protein HOK67_25140 [Deltaproteobacteria bacterium]|jgi:hypothetical protein|nr:hypothetical protein [Deltaproteobacteria bacterium]